MADPQGSAELLMTRAMKHIFIPSAMFALLTPGFLMVWVFQSSLGVDLSRMCIDGLFLRNLRAKRSAVLLFRSNWDHTGKTSGEYYQHE